MKRNLFIIAILSIGLSQACNDDPDIPNPYDNQPPKEHHDQVKDSVVNAEPPTIQALQTLIFEPTCANSGCHDGTFEPDFRTVESSYNSMVNKKIIKQDLADPLEYRVKPSSSGESMLVRRMEVDINGNSGEMPIVIDPGSDWLDKKDEYIQMVKDWIDAGALDQNGNPPRSRNFPPVLVGVTAYKNGVPFNRSRIYDPIIVPEGTGTIEVWFAFEDDFTAQQDLSILMLDTSSHAWENSNVNQIQMTYQSTPKTSDGFDLKPKDHHHKATINLSNRKAGEVVWMRANVGDGNSQPWLPTRFSLFQQKTYSAIIIK